MNMAKSENEQREVNSFLNPEEHSILGALFVPIVWAEGCERTTCWAAIFGIVLNAVIAWKNTFQNNLVLLFTYFIVNLHSEPAGKYGAFFLSEN